MSHSYLCKAGNNAERQLCASTDFIALILNALRSKTQTTLLSFVDEHISELSTHEGVDMSKSSIWTYKKIRKNLAEFICEKYKLTDLAF